MYLLGQWSTSNTREHDSGGGGDSPNAAGDRDLSELNTAKDEWFVDGLIAFGVCAEMKLRRQYVDGGDVNHDNLDAGKHALPCFRCLSTDKRHHVFASIVNSFTMPRDPPPCIRKPNARQSCFSVGAKYRIERVWGGVYRSATRLFLQSIIITFFWT